jgi:flagellar secretion chaperone FliS
MSTQFAASTNAYRESAVRTASQEQLVLMLYDGAIRFLGQAAVAMGDGDVAMTHNKLRRAEAIISHLQNTLDMEQGEIPQNLLSIYLFCRRHLNSARVARDPHRIREVAALLSQLRESWEAICP